MPLASLAHVDSSYAWRDQIRSRARSRHDADRLIRLVERLAAEYGIEPRAADGARRDYLSLYPRGHQRGRVGAITLGSGRFYAVFSPDRAVVHHRSLPQTTLAERKYLTRYINSDSDMDLASEMLRRALGDRGIVSRSPDTPRTVPTPPPPHGHTTDPPGRLQPALPSTSNAPVGDPAGGASLSERAADAFPEKPVPEFVLDEGAIELSRLITKSPTYRAAVAPLGRRAPEDDRVERLLALLLTDRAPTAFQRVSAVTGMPVGRVQGFLAVVSRVLTVDGVPTLIVDVDAREVRLDSARLRENFPISS